MTTPAPSEFGVPRDEDCAMQSDYDSRSPKNQAGPRTAPLPFAEVEPTDPIEVFRGLVRSRASGNVRDMKRLTTTLRMLGWNIIAVQPKRRDGDT